MPYRPLRETDQSTAHGIIGSAQMKHAATNEKFMEGDHLQNFDQWIGPMPQSLEPGTAEIRREIQRGHVSRNVIAEVVYRHKNGVVGREPAWNYGLARHLEMGEDPTDAEKELINAVEGPATEWWDKRKIHATIGKAVTLALHQGRGVLRIFFPKARVQRITTFTPDGVPSEQTVVRARDLAEAFDHIHVDAPHPKAAVVMQDEVTMEDVGIYKHRVGDQDVLEVTFSEGYGDEAVTTLRMHVGADDRVGTTFTYPLRGNLLMGQIERPPLVTEQVREQQRALNLAETMIPRTVITSGFLERLILNAQMPGEWVADPSMPTGRRFKPAPFHTGHGTTNFLAGKEYRDLDGRTQVANPSVVFREPISPKASIEAGDAHRLHILNEVDQTHVVIAGDAMATAVARVEAKMDYLSSLRTTQAIVEALGRWLLETALALAVEIVRQSGGELPDENVLDQLKAEFRCRLQVGNVTPDEQRAIMELVEAGLIAHEDAMALLGVDNVDDALAKINAQPSRQLDISLKQAQAYRAWRDAGAPPAFAAKKVGMTPAEGKEMEAALVETERKAKEEAQQAAELAAASRPAPGQPARAVA